MKKACGCTCGYTYAIPSASVTLALCAVFIQLAEQVAEERKDQEAPEEMRPLLPEGRIGDQVRSRAVRQLQTSQLAQQLPAEQCRLLQPVQ